MKLLIVDNEPPLRNGLRSLLKVFCPGISDIEEASGVESGLQMIRSFVPDIVLLDVEMDDGSGFDLMKQVEKPSFQLIFITAHNKYAIDAFRFAAIDYLMKPIDPDALQAGIDRAVRNIKNRDISRQIDFLLHQLHGKQDHDRRIVLKDMEHIYFVKVSDILYCMAEGTYTKFYLHNDNTVIVSKNLKEYEMMLEPLGFIRTHHSYLVNPSHILRFDKTDGGSLVLADGSTVPLSQRKKETVLGMLERGSN